MFCQFMDHCVTAVEPARAQLPLVFGAFKYLVVRGLHQYFGPTGHHRKALGGAALADKPQLHPDNLRVGIAGDLHNKKYKE